MPEIVKDVEDATRLLVEISSEKKFDGIYLSGHSAGGHLAALMMSTELAKHISGLILLSGVFQLDKILKTSVNDPLNMNEKDAENFSPQNKINEIKADKSIPIYILVGEFDPQEFIRQSKTYSEKLKEFGMKLVNYHMLENKDHFNYFYDLDQPEKCYLRKYIKMCIFNE